MPPAALMSSAAILAALSRPSPGGVLKGAMTPILTLSWAETGAAAVPTASRRPASPNFTRSRDDMVFLPGWLCDPGVYHRATRPSKSSPWGADHFESAGTTG